MKVKVESYKIVCDCCGETFHDGSKYVVLYDINGGYMSPPSRCMLGFDSMFINAMNKKYGANYTMWAYKDDLVPNKED